MCFTSSIVGKKSTVYAHSFVDEGHCYACYFTIEIGANLQKVINLSSSTYYVNFQSDFGMSH